MRFSNEFWIEAGAKLIAGIILPFYLGCRNAPPGALVGYALVAGFGLALGERLIYSDEEAVCTGRLSFTAGLRAIGILLWGGSTFAMALWLA